MPWQTPKTSWLPDDPVTTTDLNRIEGNIKRIEEETRTMVSNIVPVQNPANLTEALNSIGSQIRRMMTSSAVPWSTTPPATLSDLNLKNVDQDNRLTALETWKTNTEKNVIIVPPAQSPSTDMSDTIIAAIDKLRDIGGTVQLLAGTYRINKGIFIYGGVRLRGVGKNHTTIQAAPNFGNLYQTMLYMLSNTILEDLCLDAYYAGNSSTTYAISCVDGGSAFNILVQHCRFKMAKPGVCLKFYSYEFDDIRVLYNHFEKPPGVNQGIAVQIGQSNNTNGVLKGCLVHGNVVEGFMAGIGIVGGALTKNVVISNNMLYGGTEDSSCGIQVGGPCTVVGNVVFDYASGINVIDRGAVVTGNEIIECRILGIEMANAQYNLVTSNYMRDCGFAPSAGRPDGCGIWVYSASSYNQIHSNKIYSPFKTKPKYGIRIDSACTFNWVQLNDMTGGWLTAGLSDGGTNNLTTYTTANRN